MTPGTLTIRGTIHQPQKFWYSLNRCFPLPDLPWKGLTPGQGLTYTFRALPPGMNVDIDILMNTVSHGGGVAWAWFLDKNDTMPGVDLIWNRNGHIIEPRIFLQNTPDPDLDAFLDMPLILESAHKTIAIAKSLHKRP